MQGTVDTGRKGKAPKERTDSQCAISGLVVKSRVTVILQLRWRATDEDDLGADILCMPAPFLRSNIK